MRDMVHFIIWHTRQVFAKNLLQEFAQKTNYALPVYHCQKVETPGRGSSYSCTVETGGMKYIGGAAKTKKDAEIKAARTALLAIQANYSSAESSDDDSGDDELVLTDNVGSGNINNGSVFKATDFVVLSAEDIDPKCHVEDNVEPGDINCGRHVKATDFEVLPAKMTHSKYIEADNARPGDINNGVLKSTDFEALPVGVENSKCDASDGCFPDVGADSIP
ncbi:OLC1v1030855C1 [Oldenlandia corymbosa var. corymbosa]|uniref:OLC1v1030855C1 n=1 Tax=Oldenlandia corymbosa var. corymbosa TaxID=529605 RepID=A0AAV1CHQ0_OLDCO|nr:OLC1v1030855C1 [Oldenlandia corymbosa var. corymbosa]